MATIRDQRNGGGLRLTRIISAVPFVISVTRNCMFDSASHTAHSTRHSADISQAVPVVDLAALKGAGASCVRAGGSRPEHRKTSPKSTSSSRAVSPPEPATVMLCGALEAGVAGSFWRHTPLASVVVVRWWVPSSVVATVVPGAAKPHTAALQRRRRRRVVARR